MPGSSVQKDQIDRLMQVKTVQRELLRKALAQRFGTLPRQQLSPSVPSETHCSKHSHCSLYREAKCSGQRPRLDFVGENCKYYLPPQTLRTTAHRQSFPENLFFPSKDFGCSNCGATIPENSLYCIECGQRVADLEENKPSIDQSGLEERVYDYIVQHDGDIFLTKACQELGISKEEIEGAFECLKRAGKIS